MFASCHFSTARAIIHLHYTVDNRFFLQHFHVSNFIWKSQFLHCTTQLSALKGCSIYNRSDQIRQVPTFRVEGFTMNSFVSSAHLSQGVGICHLLKTCDRTMTVINNTWKNGNGGWMWAWRRLGQRQPALPGVWGYSMSAKVDPRRINGDIMQ